MLQGNLEINSGRFEFSIEGRYEIDSKNESTISLLLGIASEWLWIVARIR
jgi:hypothetical protein